MKRPVSILLSILILIPSCNKEQALPEPHPERELSVPEKVEKEMMDVLSRDWKSLSDTLDYFRTTMLDKGKTRGVAPDGVYYEFNVKIDALSKLNAIFKVEDSTWVSMNGKMIPFQIKLRACDADFSIKEEEADSLSLSVSDVKVIAPADFVFKTENKAPLLYKEERVGYLTREEFENPDYSTGTYIVIHYYNDPRTFALYDNGLYDLLKKNLKNVIK